MVKRPSLSVVKMKLGSLSMMVRRKFFCSASSISARFGDVERDGDDVGHPPGLVAHRPLGGQEDAPLAAAVDELFLEGRRRLAGAHDRPVELEIGVAVHLADQIDDGLADRVVGIDAEERGHVAVDEDAARMLVGRADHRRHGVDHAQQLLARLAHLLLVEAVVGAQALLEL
jgi:hypothetical protein